MDELITVSRSIESEAISAITMGFSFAAAIAWMDVIRWFVATVVKANKSSGKFALLAAVFTTILSALVFLVLKFLMKRTEAKKSSYSYN
jgi:hypothetical protein